MTLLAKHEEGKKLSLLTVQYMLPPLSSIPKANNQFKLVNLVFS